MAVTVSGFHSFLSSSVQPLAVHVCRFLCAGKQGHVSTEKLSSEEQGWVAEVLEHAQASSAFFLHRGTAFSHTAGCCLSSDESAKAFLARKLRRCR